jgi:GNAT superfamily N-acetyltransferase
MTKNQIAEIIFEGLFINERRSSSTLLDIPKIRGYITPISDAWANRVSSSENKISIEKIREVQQFFNESNSGFTWAVTEEQIARNLPQLLLSCGLKPARYHQVAGMALQHTRTHNSPRINDNIVVRECDQETLEQNIDAVIKASGISNEAYIRHIMAKDKQIQTKVFFSYLSSETEPTGYAKSCHLRDGTIHMLMGAAVKPEHRNRGTYTALLQHRISEAESEGVYTHITQSLRSSSFSTCTRFGFKEICSLEFYEWNPKN